MTEPTQPGVYAPPGIPAQRSPSEHPMAPYEGAYPPPVPERIVPEEPYGHWGLRVAAALIDAVLQIPFAVVQVIGMVVALDGGGLTWVEHPGFGTVNDTISVNEPFITTNTWIGLAVANVANLAWLVFFVWNTRVRQGRRGASIGKSCMNLVLVSEHDGRPIGTFRVWLRSWVHLLDLVTLGIGYLWPLWDRKRQTFADMVMKTAVLHLPPRTR
jgi:uncharacterized RDD family membrane protein YckC